MGPWPSALMALQAPPGDLCFTYRYLAGTLSCHPPTLAFPISSNQNLAPSTSAQSSVFPNGKNSFLSAFFTTFMHDSSNHTPPQPPLALSSHHPFATRNSSPWPPTPPERQIQKRLILSPAPLCKIPSPGSQALLFFSLFFQIIRGCHLNPPMYSLCVYI